MRPAASAGRAARRSACSKLAAADFPRALAELLGDWHALDVPRFAAGMIGSRQGWVEAPYVAVSRRLDALARAPRLDAAARELAIVPGLISRDRRRRARRDARRGNAARGRARPMHDDALLAVLPGHAQQMGARRGRPRRRVPDAHDRRAVRRAAREQHPRTSREACGSGDARRAPRSRSGVARGLAGGGLGHAIFGARTLALTGELAAQDVPDWLSGVLIGHEIGAARQWASDLGVDATRVRVIGSDALVTRYTAALAQAGIAADAGPPDAAVRGLMRIADRAGHL